MNEAPLMQLSSSSQRILIFHDRLERHAPGLFKLRVDVIPLENLNAVRVMRGILFSKMRFERKDGRLIEVTGVNKRKAEKARMLLGKVGYGHQPHGAPQSQNLAHQIRELAVLRDEGLLTDDEFQRTKTQLLGL